MNLWCRFVRVASTVATFCVGNLILATSPNIIFILTDDQGWGDVAYNGNPYVVTPNIDALANDGLVLNQFYVNGPVCSPSRVAFTTGRYPAREGFNHITSRPSVNDLRLVPDWLDPDRTTIADVFRNAGYNTAHYGKWHMGKYGEAPDPGEYGFTHYNTATGPGVSLLDRYGVVDSSPAILDNLAFDAAIQFIRENPGQPFYMNLWTPLPHAPLEYTAEEQGAYGGLIPDAANPFFAPWMQSYINAAGNPASQMRMHLTAISQIDANIGRLLGELETLGLDTNTIVIFSSDNGPEDYHIGNAGNAGMGSAGPYRGRKRSIYEGGIREPCIIKWPGVIASGVVDESSVIAGVDFLPTLAALAGISLDPFPLDIDGEDMSGVFLGTPMQREKPLYWEWFFEVAGDSAYFALPLAMRDGQWKFYSDYAGSQFELYDLEADPSEQQNIASEHPEVVDRLLPLLLEWEGTLPNNLLRDAVKQGADRNNLLEYTPYLGMVSYEFTDGNFDPTRPGYTGVMGGPLRFAGVSSTGFSSNSPSEGYELASGGENFYTSEPSPPGAAGVPYYAFTLYPDFGKAVHLKRISFGARTLVYPALDPGPGPKRYEVRTSKDAFGSVLAGEEFNIEKVSFNYWYFYDTDLLNVFGELNTPLEVRLYFEGASEGFRGGAFRVDDIRFHAEAVSEGVLHLVSAPLRLELSGGNAQISFNSFPGLNYQLQVSKDGMQSWSASGPPAVGDGTDITVSPPEIDQPGQDAIFYRLQAKD